MNIDLEVFHDRTVSDPSERPGFRIKCRYADAGMVAHGESFSSALRTLADQIERAEFEGVGGIERDLAEESS